MAKMVDQVQPHCDETITTAMTCSHFGSISSVLTSKLIGGAGAGINTSSLPNPVFIEVGTNTIYAFDYAPRGLKFKIKKKGVRCSRDDLKVTADV